jgi:drug/metabolite transporter (DMT)-like permease
MNKKLGFISLLVAAACFGSFGVWIRLLGKEMGVYEQIVLRNGFAFVFAFLIVVLGKHYRVNFRKVSKLHLVLYSLVVPVAVIFFNLGMLNQKIAVATFAFYIGTILFSELIGLILYKEKLNRIRMAALVLVIIGLSFFIYPFTLVSLSFGLIACLASGLFDAIGNGFRKHLAEKVDKFMLVGMTAVGGIIVSGGMMVHGQQNLSFLTTLSPSAWLVGLIFGGLLILVNYLLLVGFQNFELGPGVITLSSELLFALIFGFIVFKEIPAPKELIGGLFIFTASVIPNIQWAKWARRKLKWAI